MACLRAGYVWRRHRPHRAKYELDPKLLITRRETGASGPGKPVGGAKVASPHERAGEYTPTPGGAPSIDTLLVYYYCTNWLQGKTWPGGSVASSARKHGGKRQAVWFYRWLALHSRFWLSTVVRCPDPPPHGEESAAPAFYVFAKLLLRLAPSVVRCPDPRYG